MYQEFLQKNGCSPNLIWVEPADVLHTGTPTIYIKLPVPQANLARVRERFETGLRSGLGVCFQSMAELENATCCFAWVPEDEADQECHMMGSGLKISALSGESRRKGVGVKSRLRWALLKKRFQKHSAKNPDLFR